MKTDSIFKTFKKDFINFSEIDKKVKYINEHRYICEDTFKELNTRIDLDFVKSSEMLEGHTIEDLQNINFSNYVRVLHAEPKLLKNPTQQEKEELMENSSLVVMYKDSKGEIQNFICKMPSHLNALNYAMENARQDHIALNNGAPKNVDVAFIEKVNQKLFANTDKNGLPGYGEFRHALYLNGKWFKSNVRLQGDPWIPPDCDEVDGLMKDLVDDYNKSKLHPIIKAVLFKTQFIKIHPFRDGNGRTSRILLNYMLVRYGYPTVTIRGGEKKVYIAAMNKAVVNNDYNDLFNIIKSNLDKRCNKYIRVIREQSKLQNSKYYHKNSNFEK